MCGIAGIFGRGWTPLQLERMASVQRHRGPDDWGTFVDATKMAGLAHTRLSILDLSPAGHQPMTNASRSLQIVFNGEIYNYLELRRALSPYPFQTGSDTEVILAAYEKWGECCVDHFLGMFAFLIWDIRNQRLFGARDRFGVKPLYYAHGDDGTLMVASEIRALHVAGIPREMNQSAWATYLTHGLADHSDATFWEGISTLEPGYRFTWKDGVLKVSRWYDLAERSGPEIDSRPLEIVCEEYANLLADSIRLRFRSDVEVGIAISGGLDSSLLLGLVHETNGNPEQVKAFTYTTGDPRYDELPWVKKNLERMKHPSLVYELLPEEIPDLAASVQAHEDEPFGGFPTLAYARLFELAKDRGVTVLLDGQGMDEQWAGYDYYLHLDEQLLEAPLQGTRQQACRPDCLTEDFRQHAVSLEVESPFPDKLRSRQYLDTRYTKIPRALRFNDRVSMRASVELREPFMDHRLFELALRQPRERKILDGVGKQALRLIAKDLLPSEVTTAPKRPVQTPQREWLAGPLRDWAQSCIEVALAEYGGNWFRADRLTSAWKSYRAGESTNSYYIWQWISLGLVIESSRERVLTVQ
jgi:asparagine synthase (glutamine-hydrolysing)